jgi:hypothetical protein
LGAFAGRGAAANSAVFVSTATHEVYREVAPKVGGDAAADAIPAAVDTGTLIRIPPRSLLDYLHMFSHPPLARFYHCLRDRYLSKFGGRVRFVFD